jgi:uncharacterized ion transporter superfamily protein YfcC
MGDDTVDPDTDQGTTTESRKLKFPTALTVLAIILIAVWVASFFIPSGLYEVGESGPIPGTYQELPTCAAGETPIQEGGACVDKSFINMFRVFWDATPTGLYGVEGAETGFVGPDELGFLYGSAQIFFFVLAVGAFITITMRTGAIQTGIGRLALRYRHSPTMLIVILMVVFALGGTTYGMWEETLGFFALLVPLALALGYDRMTGAAIILLGAGSGVIASTVNPFATGVASDAAGISISDGIGLRLLMWLLIVPLAIGYVLWYANRVRKDPSKSVLAGATETDLVEAVSEESVPRLTVRQRWILVLFALAFVIMIYGFIPWNDVWQNIFGADFPIWTFADFYFTQASMLFLVMAVIIGLIDRMSEGDIANTIVAGAADFLGAALVIVAARGITVVMKNTYITDTILNFMEDAVSGTGKVAFAELAWIANIPIAFLVPSSSGHAALVMPILAPLADFAGVARSVAVTAYQSASGFVNLWTPTAAVVLGGLTLAKVGYDKYLRFLVPFLVILFVVVSLFMMAAAYLGGTPA